MFKSNVYETLSAVVPLFVCILNAVLMFPLLPTFPIILCVSNEAEEKRYIYCVLLLFFILQQTQQPFIISVS